MIEDAGRGAACWADAELAAAMLAVDGCGLGGVLVRARAGPVRDRWLRRLRSLSANRPWTRLPLHADADRLAGGLDLAATLGAGRPVAERGLLQEADGGTLLIGMAERLEPDRAATIAMTMDTGRVQRARWSGDGDETTRFGVVALDESAASDEAVPAALAERLALHIDLENVTLRDLGAPAIDADLVAAARRRLPEVRAGEAFVETLCTAAVALGVASVRIPWLALRAARAAAALGGRNEVAEEDLAVAARLVLAPRATTLPASGDEAADDEAPPDESPETPPDDDREPPREDPTPPDEDAPDRELTREEMEELLTDRILEAVRASVPEGLLDESRAAAAGGTRRGAGGKSGALQRTGQRGRPAGVRRGRAGPQARLNLVETLRAAAPWQKLRGVDVGTSGGATRIAVRQDDFRVTRFKQRRETTTIFVVDASGSAALHRLAEAKGAVELLLADCYVRRDRVALVTFRGTGAEVLLPPTRSLVQAKRRLAELPGGGGTPLAAGLERALELSDAVTRRGATPVVVVLTDGRANIAADGTPGRQQAHADAVAAGRLLQAAGPTVLLVDTSPRPRAEARELATSIGARYVPLPHADAANLSAAVQAETG